MKNNIIERIEIWKQANVGYWILQIGLILPNWSYDIQIPCIYRKCLTFRGQIALYILKKILPYLCYDKELDKDIQENIKKEGGINGS